MPGLGGIGPIRTARRLVLILCVLVAAAPAATARASSPSEPGPPQNHGAIPDQYIVTLVEPSSPKAVAEEHRRKHGARILHVYEAALLGYAARMSATAAERVRSDPRVALVEPDRVVSLAAQELPTGADRIDAEKSPTAMIDGLDQRVDVDIAILDTGIQTSHPDLNVAGGWSCVPGERTIDDGHGHGTHVAGIAAAKDNAVGAVGVAPGARLWAVKVLGQSGAGTWSSVICGINWITDNTSHPPIEVVNVSLVGPGEDGACDTSSLHKAVCRSVYRGTTYAVAAGNDFSNANTSVPATYSQVITVSALADFDGKLGGLADPTCFFDGDDTFADFSNFGPDIDLIAPGVCIVSTYIGAGYETFTGTSQAAPHVAGAAALYKATHPSASPATVKSALQSAGTYSWKAATDPDAINDKLLNVAAL